MWHHYMTSFRRVFVLLVVTFATDTTPTVIFKPFDDLFTGHKLFIHTNTHRVKVKEEVEQLSTPHLSTRRGGNSGDIQTLLQYKVE
jgi:hypothetical protein